MSEQIAQEPTMEEILASIRRIISEDEAPGGAPPDAAPALHAVEAAPAPAEPHEEFEDEDVLELNTPFEAEPSMDDIEAAPRFEAEEPDFDDVEPMPEPMQAFSAFSAAPAAPAGAGLVDEPVANTVATTFASLSMNMALPREGRTLEDLVKELMFPILRDWLNQNLPTIVEAQVRAEVDRLSRMRGR
jgi:cell pole-organizing protein PopZ